ncbi:MAG: response regulator, partial [Desulfobacterales bacterium]|nr:response regulator [Desulfobacterales bacterium]
VTKDDLKGSILIKKGKIIHAEHKEQKGTNAFFEILSWENGNFETLTLPHEAPGTIDSQSMYLLMEAARRSDEKNKAARERERAGETRAGETRAGEKADAPRTGIVRRVLVVEDSPMMCGILKGMLDADPDIEVVGTAKNGDEALKKIDALEPDLITLDVNMPVMDGGTALKHIMMKKACPVVIISSPRANAQENIIDFLRLGAVEFISKPRKNEGAEYRERLVKRIKLAAEANIGAFRRVPPQKILTGETPDAEARTPCRRLVVFLSGIGGCAELIKAIPPLPESRDASLLVFQSMSSDLISPLSEYLDKRSRCKITPSRSGARLYGGACYISNDDLLLKYATIGDVRFLSDADVRAGAAPGVGAFDYFLDSIPGSFADRVLVALLSGARADGLDGLKRFKEKGGRIIAQDPDACMAPRLLEEAAEAGLIEQSARSDEIADRIRSWRDG